jgi:hypothetical protein
MRSHDPAARPSILAYLSDPSVEPELIGAFFHTAIAYVDTLPWSHLTGESPPILLDFYALDPPVCHLAMIVSGDALGLALVRGLPEPAAGLSHPALTVLFAGYPDASCAPLRWRGQELPRSRAGLLAWPTVHDVDDRVRAPHRDELQLLTWGLFAVPRLLGRPRGEPVELSLPDGTRLRGTVLRTLP